MWKIFVFCSYNQFRVLRPCGLCFLRTLFKVSSNVTIFLNVNVHQLLKWGAWKFNHVGISNSCAYNFFPFVEPGTKNGKMVFQRWFLCKLLWFIHCGVFLLEFYICLQGDAEFNAVWVITVLFLLTSVFD